MWYGGLKVVIKILGKDIGVVSNHAFAVQNTIHPGGTTLEIKYDRNKRYFLRKYVAGLFNKFISG